MGIRQTSGSVYRTFKLIQKASENEVPRFVEQKKEGDKYVDGEIATEVFGRLTDIRQDVYQNDNGTAKVYTLTLDDDSEVIKVKLSNAVGTKSLLNSLANDEYDINDVISISVYRSKYKVDDKERYSCGISVKKDGTNDRISWKYQSSEIPKAKEITLGDGTKIKDYSGVELFYQDTVLNDIIKKLQTTPERPQRVVEKAVSIPQTKTEDIKSASDTSYDEDDLPF